MPEDRPANDANSASQNPASKQPASQQPPVTTRRTFLSHSGSALAAAAAIPILSASAQQSIPANAGPRPANHDSPNEEQPGRNNTVNDQLNPDSVWGPATDNGTVPPFKYSFDLSRKEIDSGGWTRQVTVRDLPVSKTMAGVEMRLTAGGVRELHWHVSAEWAFVIYGSARITAVDANGRSFVNDVSAGDLWLFPSGVPHSIQGLGPDGCRFLLVFNQGDFDEFDTFLLTDWFNHTPREVLAKNFGVPEKTFDMIPKEKLYIFQTEPPRPLTDEQKQAAETTGAIDSQYIFRSGQMQPNKTQPGGDVKIIDRKNFPVTNIASAIVRLKPGGLRELHWHPLSDEWQYYVSGKGRMGIFEAGGKARTMDFQQGDVGYIQVSRPHWIENTGTEDLVFLEVFPISEYQDISAGEWLAHTPARLVNEHLQVGEEFLNKIPKTESVITPI